MIMIALAYGNQTDPYDMRNTEIEYKNDKLGYGIFFLMMVLEPDSELNCEIHIVSPALRFT